MKSNEYWTKRFSLLEEIQNKYGQDTYRKIEPVFEKAQIEVQKEIEKWLYRIAENNEVSMSGARSMLDKKSLKEFKWTLEEYIKYGKENALNENWVKELENASAKYHINYLEALKLSIQQQMEVAFGNELDEIDTMARDTYSEGYYHSIFEIQKGIELGFDIARIDTNKLDKIITNPWAADGKNFSDRIWQSKSEMVNALHNELTRTCLLGKSPKDAIKNMSGFVDKKFHNTKLQAGRLVMTELAFFHSASQKDAYNELDVEEYEILATLDTKTSDICQSLDGKHLPMDQFQPGVTAPPFHVWCRSTTIPYFNDEWSGGKRAARGVDGKTYYVDGDMKYDEWKKEYIKDVKINDEHQRYKMILGKSAPSIEQFKIIQYNEDSKKQFSDFVSLIEKGELTPLVDFGLYQSTFNEINEKVIGLISKNGLEIKNNSKHFTARVIGSIEERRSGVSIKDVINILSNADEFIEQSRKNGRSIKYLKKGIGTVSVNPDTGKLIQTNPLSRIKE